MGVAAARQIALDVSYQLWCFNPNEAQYIPSMGGQVTVCVGIAVNDCLVFAADSASTLVRTDPASGESKVLNVYRHGNKVFNLYRGLPICAMTCGMGNIGSLSIASIAKDLRTRLMSSDAAWGIDRTRYTLEEVAQKARRLIFDELFSALAPPPTAGLEFWIGGYSSNGGAGHEVWKIAIESGNSPPPQRVIQDGGTEVIFSGQTTPIFRLLAGYDPQLVAALTAAKMPPSEATKLATFMKGHFATPLVAPTMPTQDAIELAEFLVDTTSRYYRFLPGADIVGGNIDIAVVTRYEGFKWIRRKHYYPANLNPLETGHV